jgi:uncharacterized protein YfaA (DUF2138 family)
MKCGYPDQDMETMMMTISAITTNNIPSILRKPEIVMSSFLSLIKNNLKVILLKKMLSEKFNIYFLN